MGGEGVSGGRVVGQGSGGRGRWSHPGKHLKGSVCTQVLSMLKIPRCFGLRSHHRPTFIQYSPATCREVLSGHEYGEPAVSVVITTSCAPSVTIFGLRDGTPLHPPQ